MAVAAPADEGVLALVEQRLGELVERELERVSFLGPDEYEMLVGHLAEFVRGGGKRLRPLLVYWGHRAAGGSPDDEDAVLAAGCAVELLHACALLIDDVMDEADLRRGRRTAHLSLADRHRASRWQGDPGRFGESAAALLGLLAFTWADAALLDTGPRLADALEVFTRLRAEVIGGQLMDMACTARGTSTLREAAHIAVYKSGKYTVERPLHLGHAIAGGDPALRAVLSSYALPLGEAFQLRDDVLGVFGDPGRTGKPAGADLRQGKQTHLLVEARRRTGAYGTALLDNVRDEADVAAARELITACGALAAVEDRIAGLAGRATAALDGSGIPADAAAALAGLAALATDRSA
ncbi:polyprenyl synthetase family protein [Actinocorallia sp. B10E7]|uniref:polyprenyl synthetase family protein n=1 Tax=Actinocorallia sp. B10E7 TaxID=3153558 RepID=UPI00325DAD02